MRTCEGPGCTVSLEGRRVAVGRGRTCRFCSEVCRARRKRQDIRVEAVRRAVLLRPRCMICNAPMRYGRTGCRYTAATCGNKRCAAARRDWFGASPKVEAKKRHREIARESKRRSRAA